MLSSRRDFQEGSSDVDSFQLNDKESHFAAHKESFELMSRCILLAIMDFLVKLDAALSFELDYTSFC